ncbi:hypothetical protein AMECASPLE_017409 [Ameca splendens]|uniref:Secreted protein n=1 Tax=Ameca splendens TaxID=208324 RepID=A0ABV1AC26_9TELE
MKARVYARTAVGGVVWGARSFSCSLTPVAAPAHCTPAPPPTHRGCWLALSLSLPPVVCHCLSPYSPARYHSLSSWFGFFPQEPSEVPPGRRFLPQPAQPAATPPHGRRGVTPHGPESLCCCFFCRRFFFSFLRVECDPDPTLFLRPDITPREEGGKGKTSRTKTAACVGRVGRPGSYCWPRRRSCCCWENSWAS